MVTEYSIIIFVDQILIIFPKQVLTYQLIVSNIPSNINLPLSIVDSKDGIIMMIMYAITMKIIVMTTK